MASRTPRPPEPPPLLLGLTEGARALSELSWFVAARPWLARQAQGDGRPVLVLPGLHAGDWSTGPLRRLLDRVGYSAVPWGLGTNIGPTRGVIEGLDALLASIRERHDGRPVSIIGQSLGGFLGAEVARRHPGAVDRLITLGSPMTITDARQSRADPLYARHRHRHLPEYAFEAWRRAPAPSIPTTSVVGRLDGVVHRHACRYEEGPLTENIEVHGSHVGLGVLPAAVYAVLDRLAVPVEGWARFRPPAHLRPFFPRSRRAEPRGGAEAGRTPRG